MRSLAFPSSTPIGLEIKSASGSKLHDHEGKEYIDLIAGVSVVPLGHGHPKVANAIRDQLDRHSHAMVYGEYEQTAQSRFAEKLSSILPRGLEKAFLVNSGAEANEAALKLGKAYTGRSEAIYFSGAYHGSTHGALSISDHEGRKNAFRPLIPACKRLPFNEEKSLERISERTAVVFMEMVEGDAGVRIPDPSFVKALRERCRKVGALLVLDEVQSGMGRTGSWWAFEQYGIVPDLLTSAKALGGGMPLGALVGSENLMNRFHQDPPLGHITTTGGHPISCAAGRATIEAIEEEKLLEDVERKGARLEKGIDHPSIKEIRRIGLMIGLDLKDAEEAHALMRKAREKGVLLFSFLSHPSGLRIAPPLNIDDADIDEACRRIRQALDGSSSG